MDTTNLRKNHPKLIFYLETAAYSKRYVDKFKREIKHILQLADSGEVLSYADVYRGYEQAGYSQSYLRIKRNIIGAIERFNLFGHYPNGTPYYPPKASRRLLCAEYKAIIDYFVEVESKRGKKPLSICTQANNASVFLLTLQQSGIMHLADVTEENVLALYIAPDGQIIRNYSCKCQTAAVLKASVPLNPACERVLAFLPAFREKRKNIQYLTADEIAKVKKVLSNGSSLALRDKAIGILALYTGLRGCDIAGMTMDAIDWENDLLHIHQQKTEAPLTLPLTAIVGNAIYDYIKMERPRVECEYIFISKSKPFRRIQGRGTTCRISSVIMKAAGIRQEPGDRQGLHIFRHHLATKLLGNGTPRPVVSNIVGHMSPNSLDAYLSADFPHLKECAIGIERFPVAQEVFAI